MSAPRVPFHVAPKTNKSIAHRAAAAKCHLACVPSSAGRACPGSAAARPQTREAPPGRGREPPALAWKLFRARVNRKNGLPRNLPPPMFIPIESGSTCQNNSPVFGGVWAIRLTPPGTLRQTALATALAEYPAISLPGETRLYGGEPWWGEVWGEANFSDSP